MEAQEGWKKHRVRYLPIFHAAPLPMDPEDQKPEFNIETCLEQIEIDPMYLVCYSCRRGYRVHQESVDFVEQKTCSNGHVHDIRCRCGQKIYVAQRVDSTRWKSIDRKDPWKYPDQRTPGK